MPAGGDYLLNVSQPGVSEAALSAFTASCNVATKTFKTALFAITPTNPATACSAVVLAYDTAIWNAFIAMGFSLGSALDAWSLRMNGFFDYTYTTIATPGKTAADVQSAANRLFVALWGDFGKDMTI